MFQASAQGAECFEQAAAVLRETVPDSPMIAECLVKAGLCYQRTGRQEAAQLRFREAAGIQTMSLTAEKILIEQGIL
ncbi:MAG: tetratricopeptide repeat protein [Spirochaetia bacterium]